MNKKPFKLFAIASILITLVFLSIKFYESSTLNAASKKNNSLITEEKKKLIYFLKKPFLVTPLICLNLKEKW